MSTLSFTCPSCRKQYDRVKHEMIGYRVKCTCGYEFRLGEKKNREPGVDKKMLARRLEKQKQTEIPFAEVVTTPVDKPVDPLSTKSETQPPETRKPAGVEDSIDLAASGSYSFADDFGDIEDVLQAKIIKPED